MFCGFIIVGLMFVGRILTTNGQASGSAIDLAHQNANMMNTKCALTPCQSACRVQDQKTGCYICSPACITGNVAGQANPGLGMNMQSLPSGQGFYGCASDTSWVLCPVTCGHKVNSLGCFQCICSVDTGSGTDITGVTPLKPTSVTLVTTAAKDLETQQPTPEFSLSARTETETPRANTLTQTTSTTLVKPTADDNDISAKFESVADTSARETTSSKNRVESSHTNLLSRVNSATEAVKYLKVKSSGFKVNNVSFILFGVIAVLLVAVLYFAFVWRKALQQLRRNKDELYFVEKAHRQDSNARLRSNELLDPVYSEMAPRPPPRPDELFTAQAGKQTPLRTLSVSSETPVKACFDDNRHDYLELI